MSIEIRAYDHNKDAQAVQIWNEVVREGMAFPQMDMLTARDAAEFFSEQSFTGVACDGQSRETVGLYILHPNNVGRCGHISNASYAVQPGLRGRGLGEILVRHSMAKAKELGFRILQFNAVVSSNEPALQLYEKLGFIKLGVIPDGFLMKDGSYEDIIPHYRSL